jgi:hypothetical protein
MEVEPKSRLPSWVGQPVTRHHNDDDDDVTTSAAESIECSDSYDDGGDAPLQFDDEHLFEHYRNTSPLAHIRDLHMDKRGGATTPTSGASGPAEQPT